MDNLTIKEIALRAGVSKSTVSRVISGKGYSSSGARDKILQLIEELQYKPNAVARAMVSQRTHNIGVLIYRRHHPIASHPFYGKILDAILMTAASLNYSVFVTTDHEMSLRSADYMMEKRVDGLILISRLQQNVIDYITKFRVPYVMVNGSTEVDGVIHIVNQDEEGGRMVAEHLTNARHSRIFVIAGPQTHRSHNLRLKGFINYMAQIGIPVPSFSVKYASTSTFGEGYELMSSHWEQFREGGYTSIFATNDMIALGAMKFLLEQSIRIPDQIAVVGFDDIDFAAMFSPSLTTIRVDTEEMGTQATILLDKLIRQEQNIENPKQLMPKLIFRQSTK
ncbi:transcriptional regulator RbsR [Paenibacillus baekrokdamisoli]|uniref:Transcriptional regulator RbsR n=1 Tax=Paenibacillus baekrokdamisoli TaxID=1712516 RepID=A0A3G9ISP8_9BACL|nr:LacI family DNA-binding transcriptional regulator [Paenibacillus baekrokdamisoli]MBB3070395.1 DNA-binding LacI/PurR family transcriptional regulator [Paenibacillus baekrokdamisoli]BBH21396.1 transcriptional regulator RbsR [Paenibacillus baekrokdamisoli]